jgi:hypothetical protein
VISVRAFLVMWAALTSAIVAYAFFDLGLSPALHAEHSFSMQPDLSQIWEVRHWGGRLVRERAWGLLACNALVLGGIAALVLHGAVRWLWRRRNADERTERDGLFSDHMPSVPPSA